MKKNRGADDWHLSVCSPKTLTSVLDWNPTFCTKMWGGGVPWRGGGGGAFKKNKKKKSQKKGSNLFKSKYKEKGIK